MSEYEEKYKQLFELAQNLSKEEADRIHRIDNKASRYISILTVFLGICVIFIRFGVPEIWPLDDILDKSVFAVFSLSFLILLVAWFFLIFALRMDDIESIQFYSLLLHR